MDLQNCWTSLSCLERWEPYLKWPSGIAAFIVIVGIVVSHYVTKQITFFKSPRSLTTEQTDTISSGLKGMPTEIFQVSALSTEEEPGQFGGQLQKALKDVGWQSTGMTQYYMGEGEPPSIGVSILVDGHDVEASKSAANLAEILRAVGIQAVQFYSTRQEPMVLIQVGRKPNR